MIRDPRSATVVLPGDTPDEQQRANLVRRVIDTERSIFGVIEAPTYEFRIRVYAHEAAQVIAALVPLLDGEGRQAVEAALIQEYVRP